MNFITIMEQDQNHICHTYNRFPVAFDHGQGATLWSTEGKAYLDFTAGVGVNALGYNFGPWVKAVQNQAAKLAHISNLYYTEPQIKVAAKLCEKTGCSKVLFSNSGAEANEGAIKAARKFGLSSGRGTQIVALQSAFHGRTMGALAATPQAAYQEQFGEMLVGFSFAKANHIDEVAEKITSETCAVMMELVQGEGGVRNLEKQFVQDVAALCQSKGILLIIDEVQTGIGRTGTLFAYEQFGICPDIVTSAKGLGGGLPVGAALFFGQSGDIFAPGDHGTTYGGNPLAMAGAEVVLAQMTAEFFLEINEKSKKIRQTLSTCSGVKEVTGMGLMVGVVLEKPQRVGEIILACLEKGLLILSAKDRLRLLPPLTISENELTQGLALLKSAIEEGQKK